MEKQMIFEILNAQNEVINTISATSEQFIIDNYPDCTYREVVQTQSIPEVKIWPVLSKLGFRNRFTFAEKTAIEFAAIDNPAGTIQSRLQSAALRANLSDQRDAKYIDVRTDTVAGMQTRAGLQILEAVGLLEVGRAAEIADAVITEAEAWKDSL